MMPREFMEPIGCSDCGDCVPLKEAQAEIAALESRVVDWIDRAAEIASLRSHLAEAETTIGGLKSFEGGEDHPLTAYNFGALPPLPDGYRVDWVEEVEHFMAFGPDEWESPITCDPHQARRWCFDRAEAMSGSVDLIERAHL